MKIRPLLAGCALAGAFAVPVLTGSAGAAPGDPTTLTVVDGYQYSANSLMSHTICLDDTLVKQDSDAIITPGIETTVGDHTLRVTRDDATCDDETADWIETPVTLLDGPAQTLAIGWAMRDEQQGEMNETWLFPDEVACLPTGKADVTFRNVSTYDPLVANFGGTPDGIEEATALIDNVPVGDEGDAQLDAGRYPADAGSHTIGWDGEDEFVSVFTELAGAEGTVTDVYAFAGNDGDVGLAKVVRDVGVCEDSTTTTTSLAPTTTVAPQQQAQAQAQTAAPVAAQPTYTG